MSGSEAHFAQSNDPRSAAGASEWINAIVSYRIPPIFIADFLSNPVLEVTMDDVEQTITALAAPEMSGRPPGLIQLLKRAPNSVRWRLIFAAWSLKREWLGIVHRLQRRRIVHFLHIGKTGGTAVSHAHQRTRKLRVRVTSKSSSTIMTSN